MLEESIYSTSIMLLSWYHKIGNDKTDQVHPYLLDIKQTTWKMLKLNFYLIQGKNIVIMILLSSSGLMLHNI